MIEINLLPGGAKRRKSAGGGAFGLKLPGKLPTLDRLTLFGVAAWIIAPLLGLWMFFGIRGEMREVQAAVDEAVADSTRYAQLIATQTSLRARQDTIAQKLAMIQEIDAGRFIWPHVLDEVSLALPAFTWLGAISQLSGGPEPAFQLEGRTGSLPALTRFMDALEASPFIRDVQLISSEQGPLPGDASRTVNNFVLTARYEAPPLETLETVPLFEGIALDTTTAGEVGNGAAP